VTPERGKKVRIIGKSLNARLDWAKLQVSLLEKHGEHWIASVTSQGFAVTGKRVAADPASVSSSISGSNVQICQIDLKLFLLGKRIAFRVDVPGADGLHSAMTAEIYTHNSGRREYASPKPFWSTLPTSLTTLDLLQDGHSDANLEAGLQGFQITDRRR